MKSKRQRRPRHRIPRDPDDSLPLNPPPRPEFLHIADGYLIWRRAYPADKGSFSSPITWDIRIAKGDVIIKADLDRQGEMREIDFREVRNRLNEILFYARCHAKFTISVHTVRIRRSLYWQRDLNDNHCHLIPAEYMDGSLAPSFSITPPYGGMDMNYPLDLPVVRPASNQMYLERREERQWAIYARQENKAAQVLALDPDFNAFFGCVGEICRLRLIHYMQIEECRELFNSSKSFVTLFCTPSIFPELDDIGDSNWKETVTQLARLSRRTLMERIGLPATQQSLRLFLRINPREIEKLLHYARNLRQSARDETTLRYHLRN